MKNLRKLFSYLLASAILSVPFTSFAHVKWFVDADRVVKSEHGLVPFYYLNSKEVIIWSVVAILVVVAFSIFDRIIPEPKKLREFGEKHERGVTRVVEIFLGLLLISITFLWGIVLVPDLPINSSFTFWLAVLQLSSGLFLLVGLFQRLATVLVFALYFAVGIMLGWMPLAENLLLPAVAFYIFIKNSKHTDFGRRADKYSVEIVRIGAAVSLIVLAFTEKLMYPELGLDFLSVHHWNFMQNLGLAWFDDKLFVLSAGFAEMIFGVIYIFGYLTRINTLVMATFFGMSVVTMLMQFHMWEMEDLIIYAAAVIFIFYGYGKTRFFHSMPEESFWRRIHLGRLFGKR